MHIRVTTYNQNQRPYWKHSCVTFHQATKGTELILHSCQRFQGEDIYQAEIHYLLPYFIGRVSNVCYVTNGPVRHNGAKVRRGLKERSHVVI